MPEPGNINSLLVELYGKATGEAVDQRLGALIEHYRSLTSGVQGRGRGELTQGDSILITYGDQVLEPGVPPLRSLAGFCQRQLQGLVSGIHILPFYPFSSDDGFSVIDYKAVNPELGGWEDLGAFRRSFRLMFDAVINHISVAERMVQGISWAATPNTAGTLSASPPALRGSPPALRGSAATPIFRRWCGRGFCRC